eukprot:357412-Chlamydomonas_euryale.AAC.11
MPVSHARRVSTHLTRHNAQSHMQHCSNMQSWNRPDWQHNALEHAPGGGPDFGFPRFTLANPCPLSAFPPTPLPALHTRTPFFWAFSKSAACIY